MKLIIILIIPIILSFQTFTDNPVERLGVSGPLEFSKTSFNLAWTDKPRSNYYIQEYLPGGENFDSFSQMITIHLFLTNMDIKDAVQQKINELTNRKKTDEICNYAVNKSPDGNELMVDFLLSESKSGKMSIVEFNIYRYRQIDIGRNEKAIMVFAYTKRSYENEITTFLETLKGDRLNYLNEMSAVTVPEVIINGN